MKPQSNTPKWLPWVLTFLGGFLVIGPLDGFHSHFGVQRYFVTQFNITDQNWPWFIPLQMGIAGIFLLYGWTQLAPLLTNQFFGEEKRRGPGAKFLFPWATAMVIFGYAFAWTMNEYPSHLGYYLGLFIGSLLYLLLLHSRHQIAAFMICGLAGVTFETLLLDPEIGYYEFVQKDLFGRAPGWLLFVYGWVGIFIHELYLLTHPPLRRRLEEPEEEEELNY